VRVGVVVVGKPRHPGLAAAIRDYEARAARYWALDVHEVREEGGRALPPGQVRDREAERLEARIAPSARVVACDPGGDALDSAQFAAWLRARRDAAQDVAFVIGGAHGLGDRVLARSHRRLALAPWTLPHELARLVLAEQLYRAGTLVRGEPYHK
jgi:23S rRNA (pseudouridine1915-N3)-methyltransferase